MAAIVAADILWKYSIKTGAAGNSTASAQATSLGKYISTTVLATAGGNEWFDDVSGAENAASTVDYRCMFIHNSNGANAYQNAGIYISAETAGGTAIAIATDNIAASAIGSASAQAAEIANETTAPTGVSAFSSPTTVGAALSLGSIPTGQCKAFWVRRTAANTAAQSDGATLTTSGETAAA
jgi:hypothetical protein